MLADFLRSTLSNNLRQTITLEEEIKQSRLYVDIEKIRFGYKFSFEQAVDENVLTLPVPNMIIQPLLENAIKYGVYEALEEIKILLQVKRTATNMIEIIVENDYENDQCNAKHRGDGVGLANIKSRLMLIYGEGDYFRISKTDLKFSVIMQLPILD